MILTSIEARVLGSLIEKEITTPEYYPLTLNALTNACNQKNNREPVVAFDETAVVRGLETLREKKLVSTVTGAGIRVPKYKHGFREMHDLMPQEVAILCLLLLRGPQTVGELRTRSGPMYNFATLEDVQTTLDALGKNETRPEMVMKLPRQSGQKEARYTHLLFGQPAIDAMEDSARPEPARLQVLAENERITKLEEDLKSLRTVVDDLQKRFKEFKKQFE